MEAMLIWFFLALSFCTRGYTAIFKTEKEICDHLLKDYNNNYRPVRNSSHIVEVKMQMIVNQILELDEKNQVMSSQSSFLEVWKDEYLEWNTSDYDATRLLTIPKSKIWGMDLYVKNSVGDTKNLLKPFHMNVPPYTLLAEGGYCMSYNPFVLYTSCEMDTSLFPFDTQTCKITAGSWNYDSQQLKLSLMDPPIFTKGQSLISGEWKLSGSGAVINVVPYDVYFNATWNTVLFDEITFSITVTRNPSFYICNIVVPTAMLGVVAIFSFLLPPESGERVSLCLTTLLSIAVYAMVVADSVPESSRDVPLISRLLFLYMSIMAASTLWSVLATRFYYHAPSYTSPPSRHLLLLVKLSSCSMQKKEKHCDNIVRNARTQLVEMNNHLDCQEGLSNVKCHQDIVNRWRQVILGLDLILFIVFLFIFVIGTGIFLM